MKEQNTTPQRVLKYPNSALIPDYARAAIGLFLTAGPIIAFEPLVWISVILGAAALIFLALAGQTILKQLSTVTITPDGIEISALGKRYIRWREIEGLKLKFFASKRKSKEGWMQLTLQSSSTRITLDTNLQDFSDIVEMAARAAVENRIDVDTTSRENFLAIGIRYFE